MALLGIGFVSLVFLSIWYSRRKGNAEILRKGVLGEAMIVECRVEGGPAHGYAVTHLAYRFLPEGCDEPVTVTRQVEGVLEIPLGSTVPVRYLRKWPKVSVLVPYADRYDGF